MNDYVTRRVVLHFPGFEALDPEAHHARYRRGATQSARLWGFRAEIGALGGEGADRHFDIDCRGDGWRASSRIHVCDHHALAERLLGRPLGRRLARGLASGAAVVAEGGLAGYFRHGWRFGLFFLFPFVAMLLALALSLAVAATPLWIGLSGLNALWSLPAGYILFRFALLPLCERCYTLHLFADWELARAAARLDDADLTRWLEACTATVAAALKQPADEYLVTSHSMGSSLAAHVLGMVLERDPQALAGKRVAFVTLGGAILQCALLRPAETLRRRVGAIARAQEVFFLEVHCLTDVIHFYKSRVVALTGHGDAPQAALAFIRVKQMVAPERYRRIRRNFLRMHRQYVLPADRRGPFDFTLMTAGPFPARAFVDFAPESLDRLASHIPAGGDPA